MITGCGKNQEGASLELEEAESDLTYIQSKGTLVAGIIDFAQMDYWDEGNIFLLIVIHDLLITVYNPQDIKSIMLLMKNTLYFYIDKNPFCDIINIWMIVHMNKQANVKLSGGKNNEEDLQAKPVSTL